MRGPSVEAWNESGDASGGLLPSQRSYVVGLGGNIAPRRHFFCEALRLLVVEHHCALLRLSRVVCSPSLLAGQPDYFNAAALLDSADPPHRLLDRLHDIESRLGRTRTVRWGPRTIDLDMLWWDGPPIGDKGLEIPHPRLLERAFALGPLLEVAPWLRERWGQALARLGGPGRVVGSLPERSLLASAQPTPEVALQRGRVQVERSGPLDPSLPNPSLPNPLRSGRRVG